MPSKTRFWFSHHDGLTLLSITSDDPRRDGLVTTAFFDSYIYPAIALYKWRVRHGRIENHEGASLLSIVAKSYKKGSIQIEPNDDFTSRNFRHRTGLIGGNPQNLEKFRQNPEWKQLQWNAKNLPPNFAPMRYKRRSDWVELIVEVDDSAKIAIKINTFMVQHVPTRLCLRMRRKNCTLFLCPNKKEMKRRRYPANDRRHGISLARHLLDKYGDGASVYDYARSDMYDFRIRDDGKYEASICAINNYHRVKDGVVLEIRHPEGYTSGVWTDIYKHLYPKADILNEKQERSAYYLINESMESSIREFDWHIVKGDNEISIRSKRTIDEDGKRVPSERLERFIANLAGLQVRNVVVPSRLSTYYKKAIESDNLRARAKFENTINSEVATTNRMFTKAKFIKFKQIHAEKFVAIPELDVIALDVRHESLRIGGKSKNKENM